MVTTATICRDAADGSIAAAWDALAAAAGTPNPFYHRDAVAACRGLPEAGEVALLLVSTGDRLDGLLPIAVRRKRGLTLAVENWNQRVRALGEPLVRAGLETEFWQAALPVLAAQPGQYSRLSALDGDSASTAALMAMTPSYVTREYGRAVLPGGSSSEAHVARHIRSKVLKEHRRLRARLAEQGTLRFERLAADAPADPWIDDLFALEGTGWKGREGVAAAADPVTERCYRAILNDAHAARHLDFHRMTVGGRVLSMLANLEVGDTAFQLKIAYDEAYAAFSPGVLIEMAYLTHALDDRRLTLADSCARPGHPMIDRIWPDRRRIVSLMVPHPTLVSRAICWSADRMRRASAKV